MMIDNLIAFRILYKIVTPFKDTDAYKLGIIDEKGNLLKKSAELKTSEEKNAFTMLDKLVFNIKRLIAKLPGGESKIANIAAAYFLVKENLDLEADEQLLQEQLEMVSNVILFDETLTVLSFLELYEDAPANSTGPAVSTDEPVVKPRKKKQGVTYVERSKAEFL